MFNIEQNRRMLSAGAGGSNDSLPGLEAMETVGVDPAVDKEDELADLEEREELVLIAEEEDGPPSDDGWASGGAGAVDEDGEADDELLSVYDVPRGRENSDRPEGHLLRVWRRQQPPPFRCVPPLAAHCLNCLPDMILTAAAPCRRCYIRRHTRRARHCLSHRHYFRHLARCCRSPRRRQRRGLERLPACHSVVERLARGSLRADAVEVALAKTLAAGLCAECGARQIWPSRGQDRVAEPHGVCYRQPLARDKTFSRTFSNTVLTSSKNI